MTLIYSYSLYDSFIQNTECSHKVHYIVYICMIIWNNIWCYFNFFQSIVIWFKCHTSLSVKYILTRWPRAVPQPLRLDLIWFDLIWFDMIWFDLIWFDLIWFDLIWLHWIGSDCTTLLDFTLLYSGLHTAWWWWCGIFRL